VYFVSNLCIGFAKAWMNSGSNYKRHNQLKCNRQINLFVQSNCVSMWCGVWERLF